MDCARLCTYIHVTRYKCTVDSKEKDNMPISVIPSLENKHTGAYFGYPPPYIYRDTVQKMIPYQKCLAYIPPLASIAISFLTSLLDQCDADSVPNWFPPSVTP